jgi:hypothetical protein
MSDRLGFLVSPELLSDLNSLYPHKHPTMNMTDREIWVAVGERRVVDMLQAKYLEVQENIMKE